MKIKVHSMKKISPPLPFLPVWAMTSIVVLTGVRVGGGGKQGGRGFLGCIVFTYINVCGFFVLSLQT